jgi:hypothetical protein
MTSNKSFCCSKELGADLNMLRTQLNIVLDYAYDINDAACDVVSWELECKISDMVKEVENLTDDLDLTLQRYRKEVEN